VIIVQQCNTKEKEKTKGRKFGPRKMNDGESNHSAHELQKPASKLQTGDSSSASSLKPNMALKSVI
jgi:hypothetical protein